MLLWEAISIEYDSFIRFHFLWSLYGWRVNCLIRTQNCNDGWFGNSFSNHITYYLCMENKSQSWSFRRNCLRCVSSNATIDDHLIDSRSWCSPYPVLLPRPCFLQSLPHNWYNHYLWKRKTQWNRNGSQWLCYWCFDVIHWHHYDLRLHPPTAGRQVRKSTISNNFKAIIN